MGVEVGLFGVVFRMRVEGGGEAVLLLAGKMKWTRFLGWDFSFRD